MPPNDHIKSKTISKGFIHQQFTALISVWDTKFFNFLLQTIPSGWS